MNVPRAEFADVHQVVALCGELSGLATTDSGLRQIVTVVARQAGLRAAVLDESLSALALYGGPEERGTADPAGVLGSEPETLSQLIAAAARMRRAVSMPAFGASAVSLVVAPILVGEDPVAYLVTAARDADEAYEDSRIMVTEHAAMVSAVIMSRRRVVAMATGRARQELFDGLVLVSDRTEADVEGWARHLGIEPGRPHRALVAAVEPLSAVSAPAAGDLVERFLATRCPNATVVNRGTEVVALVPGDGDANRLIELARLCRETATGRFSGIRLIVGLSDAHTGAVAISTSYAEARHAVDIGRLMPGLDDVTEFAALGIHRLLAEVRDPARLNGFANDVLGELIDYDRANGTPLCETLTMYFRQNNSPQRAAALLHAHPNTVVYRVRRAGEIIGLDLDAYSDRLVVQVALEIVNGMGGGRCVTAS